MDYVRAGEGRLKRLNIEKGLLRETESVQDQIKFLLRCEVCATAYFRIGLLTVCAAFSGRARKRNHTDCLPSADNGLARALSRHERGHNQRSR